MGKWNITILGTGAHHGKANEADANRMAAAFVDQLRAAGHEIRSCTFHYGDEGLHDQVDGEQYLKALAEIEARGDAAPVDAEADAPAPSIKP
jgi:type IV pilus biogenesis protein CpaD/CtpE